MASITIDITDFSQKVNELIQVATTQNKKALFAVGGEIMRLSSFEVPHDKGLLQSSADIQIGSDEVIIGYNKVYAARLHEHPEYHFQKGRKGKYLEDPIKHNLNVLQNFYGESMKEVL